MQVAPKASTGHGGSGDGEGRHKQKQQAFHRTRVGHDCDGIKVTRVSSEHGKADGVDAIKFWDQAIERLKQGEKWIIVNEECRKLKMSARHKHVLRTEIQQWMLIFVNEANNSQDKRSQVGSSCRMRRQKNILVLRNSSRFMQISFVNRGQNLVCPRGT